MTTIGRVEPLEVLVDGDNNIRIDQHLNGGEDQEIVIHPDQVDLLRSWLGDAEQLARQRLKEAQAQASLAKGREAAP